MTSKAFYMGTFSLTAPMVCCLLFSVINRQLLTIKIPSEFLGSFQIPLIIPLSSMKLKTAAVVPDRFLLIEDEIVNGTNHERSANNLFCVLLYIYNPFFRKHDKKNSVQ